jgi:hypothetical protein
MTTAAGLPYFIKLKLSMFCLFLFFFAQTSRITALGVFSDAFPGHKMQAHLITAPNALVTGVVTPPSTKSNRTNRVPSFNF